MYLNLRNTCPELGLGFWVEWESYNETLEFPKIINFVIFSCICLYYHGMNKNQEAK